MQIDTFPALFSILLIFALFGHSFAANDCPDTNVITRSMWGAQQSNQTSYLILPLSRVIVHHAATPACATLTDCSERVRNIQSHHMQTYNWNDIGFSFLIGGDGNVYEGTGWSKEGAHTYGWNKKSLGLVFIGNFQDIDPSDTMMDAAHKLIACGKVKDFLRDDVKVLGARQVQSTISPGNKLLAKIQTWPEWSSTL